MIGRKSIRTDVVAAVREQSEQAAALAQIAGQERLADPRLNPSTRGHADRLRDEQQVRALDAEHGRALRRHRVADQHAADAEETLTAIALARQTASPARSVLALHRGRRLYLRASMAAALALAAGSAMGVEAAAHALDAPRGTGLVAEVGLTGLSTAVILYRGHLAEHRGEVSAKWQKRVLWALMVVPLLVSVSANVAMTNLIGASCAVGAAAFSLLSYIVADRSAAAMAARAAEVDDVAEEQLRAAAMGEDLFAPVPTITASADSRPEAPLGPGEVELELEVPELGEVEAEARDGVIQLAAWLESSADPPEDEAGTGLDRPPLDGDGPQGAAKDAPSSGVGDHIDGRAGGHIDPAPGQIEPDQAGGPRARVQAAAEARREAGDQTRARVAAFFRDHPRATNQKAAQALALSTSTVKRARRDNRRQRAGGGR